MSTTPFRRGRKRVTHPSARLAERVARTLITIGGIGTILAVTLIMVFLLWVAVPLFRGASIGEARELQAAPPSARILAAGVDEYRVVGWTITADARATFVRLDTGAVLEERALCDGAAPTALAIDAESQRLALGFADGSARLGVLAFDNRVVGVDDARPEWRALAIGAVAATDGGVVRRASEEQWRVQRIDLRFDAPFDTGSKAPIRLIDQVESARGRTLALLDDAGQLALCRITERENILTGEITTAVERNAVAYALASGAAAPERLMLAGGGTMLYLAARDGTCERFDLRDLDRIALAEHVDLVDDPRPELASLRFVLGRTTLLAGDSAGRLDAWFPTKPDGATTVDGATLVRAHELARGAQAVAATASSQRSRVVAVGFADGAIELFNVTSSKDLGRVDAGAPIRALALAPREDGLVAWTDRGLRAWDLELGHTEATVAALFRPVWYEGYERPEQVWQSTSGGDDFEPKLGLWPLVFGTLKATFYSLLFGVPLAILAALFSSEFLTPRVRVPIKSTVEIMAGLPSVVLGFLAAIIFAPFVQSVVPAVLVGFVAIPFALLCGAHAWQLLPQRIALRFADWRRFLCIVAMIPLGVALSAWAGPWVECWFFGGDLEVWLSGRDGSAVGGWMLLFLPLSALVVAFANGRVLMPWLRGRSVAWKRAQCARADFARFAFNACATVALALVLSAVVSAAGFDARGSYVDTFVQRNALVVGFVMGFAIIPIIYTIAEDALSSVPEHLRLASLAAGATPWQTAVRVILPTAASGLFSAVMVGLGRAVGETMIVLMATGNTAVLDWNMFSGFRTLSANIATELPEAVRNSTHYRTLFLAALVLFAMTFAVNTAAEVVRQRFRKRAFQL